MSQIVPQSQTTIGGGLQHVDRHVRRELVQLNRQHLTGLARLDVGAQLQAAKVEAVSYVGGRALEAVALLSEKEAQLSQLCPSAVTRLQGIADLTAISIAEVVAETARKLP